RAPDPRLHPRSQHCNQRGPPGPPIAFRTVRISARRSDRSASNIDSGGEKVFGEEASVTDPPGLDVKRLQAYLEREHPGLLGGTVSALLFDGGRSNLTYALTD